MQYFKGRLPPTFAVPLRNRYTREHHNSFANTPDMQYFKGMLPPTFRVPLTNDLFIKCEFKM